MGELLQWNGDDMYELFQNTKVIDEKMRATYLTASTLYADLDVDEDWEGKHRDTFVAWMHLLLQYHNKLNEGMDKLGSPAGKAAEALDTFIKQWTSFESDYEPYKRLERVE